MWIDNVKELPVVDNVCGQIVREVERLSEISVAHVTMRPLAASLLHHHQKTSEIYVVTHGFGELAVGYPGEIQRRYQVAAGSVYFIPVGASHVLTNKCAGHLEHLVISYPPFDSVDVKLDPESWAEKEFHIHALDEPEDCFDGAKVIPHRSPNLDLSVAFGWVGNIGTAKRRPHFHREATEFIYVVEGDGHISHDRFRYPIRPGFWASINPEVEHGLTNDLPEDLVVVCICSPAFKMADVHYR